MNNLTKLFTLCCCVTVLLLATTGDAFAQADNASRALPFAKEVATAQAKFLEIHSRDVLTGATVATDKPDYSPGEIVTITGEGWAPGEIVDLDILNSLDGHDYLTATANAAGEIYNNEFLITWEHVGLTFWLTATGRTSAQVAMTSFTDGLTNPDQAQNGGIGDPPINPVTWINGNVNAQKGHYVEGQSIPYRVRINSLVPSQPARFRFFFEITKGGKHAIDFITGPERIAEQVQPTDGFTATFPGAGNSFPIPLPPFASAPLTRSYALLQQTADAGDNEALNMYIWNGTITSITYSNSTFATGTWGNENATGDENSYVDVIFTPTSSDVMLAWGGHIAREDDWGLGNGATAIPGSPYHTHMGMICLSATLPDNQCTSIGNQDLQLAAAAVCKVPVVTVNSPTICLGSSATLTATSTPSTGVTYLWSPGGATTASITVSPAVTTTYTVVVTNTNGGCSSVPASGTVTVKSVIATSSFTPILCNGGSSTVTVSASGGTPPYTGTGTFTRSAGTYSYTVTDALSCTGITTGNITQPPVLTASASAPPILCYGGTTTVTVSAGGGTPAYSGTGTFTRGTGSYTFVVTDANSCTAQATINITQPPLLTVSVDNDTICLGENATLTATVGGGTPGYTYLWTPGSSTSNPLVVSPASTQSYTVRVTDANGCWQEATGTVTVLPLTAIVTPPSNLTCPDPSAAASFTVVVSGTGPFTYTWKKGGSTVWTDGPKASTTSTYSFGPPIGPSDIETYRVDIDGECNSVYAEATLSCGYTITCEVTPAQQEVCAGANAGFCVTPNGGVGPYTYLWSGPNGFSSTNSCITINNAQSVNAGTYTVQVTDYWLQTTSCYGDLVVHENPVCTLSPPEPLPQCGQTNATLTTTPGFANYAWTVVSGGVYVSGNGGNVLTYDVTSSPIVIRVIVNTEFGCLDTCEVTFDCEELFEFCSRTQGFYGSTNGKFCGGPNARTLIGYLLSAGGPMVFGLPGQSLTVGVTDALCLNSRMPGGGRAQQLPPGNVNVCAPIGYPLQNGRFKNNLLAQAITLTLNGRLNLWNSGSDFGSVVLTPTMHTVAATSCTNGQPIPGTEGTISISASIIAYLTAHGGATVNNLLALANQAMGTPAASWHGPSYSEIAGAMDALNNGFDKCSFLVSNSSRLLGSSLSEAQSQGIPAEYALHANFPNPFNPTTTIRYELPEASTVRLTVFNILGQQVASLVNGVVDAGFQNVQWNSTNSAGVALASGVYIYRMEAFSTTSDRQFTKIQKMVLMK